MSIKNGYTQINNTLLWALMQLPKRQQLVFSCLRIESDYNTHLTKLLSVKDIANFTSLHRNHVSSALKLLETNCWITKIDRKGYAYIWELSIAKLTNAEVHEFLQAPVESQPEAPPVDRFITDTINDKTVKMLMLGPRVYRYNAAISDFEAKLLYTGDDAWEIANGHIDYLSEADKTELQAYACG